jgi:hypothetical protein
MLQWIVLDDVLKLYSAYDTGAVCCDTMKFWTAVLNVKYILTNIKMFKYHKRKYKFIMLLFKSCTNISTSI